MFLNHVRLTSLSASMLICWKMSSHIPKTSPTGSSLTSSDGCVLSILVGLQLFDPSSQILEILSLYVDWANLGIRSIATTQANRG
jgi:hypothetical protein